MAKKASKKAEEKSKKGDRPGVFDGPSKKEVCLTNKKTDQELPVPVVLTQSEEEFISDLEFENLSFLQRLLIRLALRKELLNLEAYQTLAQEANTAVKTISTAATTKKGRRIVRLRFNPGPA